MMLRNRMRIFNKYVTNRVLRGLASFSHGPFAIIRHVGRRSGKPFLSRNSSEEFLAFLWDAWGWREVGANLEKEATS
jgi:hypothetical protein